MKKFTLFSLLALFCSVLTANADLQDKFFYKIANDSQEGWTLLCSLTPTNDFLKVRCTSNSYLNFSRFFNENGWTKMQDLSQLPDNTYQFSIDINLVEPLLIVPPYMYLLLLPVNSSGQNSARLYHWYNNAGEDYFFRFRVYSSTKDEYSIVINENPTYIDDWPPVTEESETAVLRVGDKYSFNVSVNVAEKTASYQIVDGVGEIVKSGVHKYVCEENRIGIIATDLQGDGLTAQFSNMGLSYKSALPCNPTISLFDLNREERNYFAEFNEGEVLHWRQLGDVVDPISGKKYTDGMVYSVDYADARDAKNYERCQTQGGKIIKCSKSGTLYAWTSSRDDNTIVSDEVAKDVVCTDIVLPTPVATLANVEPGFNKEYSLTVDNSDVLFKPTITIHYTVKDKSGVKVKEGDVLSGETISAGAGTIEIYSWDKSHPTEYYARSEKVTIVNNIEYALAEEHNFAISKQEAEGTMEGCTPVVLNNFGNISHWERIYSDQKYGYRADGTAEAYDETHIDDYVSVKEGFGYFPVSAIGTSDDKVPCQHVNPDAFTTAVAPLVIAANERTDAYWYIFPQEGLVSYQTRLMNVPLTIDPRYISDNPAIPNFYVVHTRDEYDRPDRGDCNKNTVVEAGKEFLLYRYNTAICDVKVLTYKDIIYIDENSDTDISRLPNAIYTDRVSTLADKEVKLKIKMKNDVGITSFQFNLDLPEDVTVAKDEDDPDYYALAISGDRTTAKKHNTLDGSYVKNGTFLVTCASSTNAVFSGSDGEVLTMTIAVPEGMEPGDYPMYIRGIVMTEAGTNKSIKVNDIFVTLTIDDYIPGDANSDGEVNVSDYSMIISYIHEEATGDYNVKAMDVNEDGEVNVSDASATITLLHNQ